MEAIWTPETPKIKEKGCDLGSPDIPNKKPKEQHFPHKNLPHQTRPSTHAPPTTQGRNGLVGSRASVKEFLTVQQLRISLAGGPRRRENSRKSENSRNPENPKNENPSFVPRSRVWPEALGPRPWAQGLGPKALGPIP